MKRSTQRLSAAVCTILAAVSIASGCTSEKATTEGNGTATPPAAQSGMGDLTKKQDISWFGRGARGKIEDGNFVQKMIEEKFNVKLTNKKIDVNNKDQVTLMFASGEMADAMYNNAIDASKYYRDGLLRSIPKSMIQKYAPKYSKMLDESPGGWNLNRARDKTDEYYSMTGISQHVDSLQWGQVYRLDWLEKFGIKPKGEAVPIGTSDGKERVYFTKEAFTLEEEAQMFDRFVNGDPDGNGKKDTFGLTMNNQSTKQWATTYLGAFGLGELGTYNMMEDGKLVEASISKKYKEFLKLFADWHKKGYVDPEFTTSNLNKSWEKFAAGKLGSAQVSFLLATLVPGYTTRPPGNLLEKDPNAKILFTPPVIGANGQQGASAARPVNSLTYDFIISKNVSDEKLARILQIFDYINFDKDGAVLTSFGVEGKHFKWEGVPYQSAAVALDGILPEGNTGLTYYNHVNYTDEFLPYMYPKETVKLIREYFGAKDLGMKKQLRPYKFDLYEEQPPFDSNKLTKILTIGTEYMFKAIANMQDIDSTWDAYVKSWNDNGGKDWLEYSDKAPKVEDLRAGAK